MPPRSETPARRRLRRLALAAVLTNIGIVVTGGAVRITGSGLGCPTWPTCDGDRLVPLRGASHTTWQTAIEFGNRLLTFVVLAAAVAVLVQVRRTRPHPPAVEPLTWFVVGGILGQALLGGVTVLTGLSPITVAAHFLLSMALISATVSIHELVRRPFHPPDRGPASPGLRVATTSLAIVGFVVLLLGTITTGAGPHGGDISAPRFGIDIRLIAIAHADAVWLLLGLTLALVAVTWRAGPNGLRTALRALLAIEVAQGLIGYSQYALGVPRELVMLHVVGAALVWTAISAVWIRAHRSVDSYPADLGRPSSNAGPDGARHDPEVASRR